MIRRTLLTSLLLFTVDASALDTGADLYQQHCSVCHGHQANRKAWNVTDKIATWSQEMIVEALEGYKHKERNVYGFGDYMHPQISRYSDEEINAIAYYISALGKRSDHLAAKSRR